MQKEEREIEGKEKGRQKLIEQGSQTLAIPERREACISTRVKARDWEICLFTHKQIPCPMTSGTSLHLKQTIALVSSPVFHRILIHLLLFSSMILFCFNASCIPRLLDRVYNSSQPFLQQTHHYDDATVSLSLLSLIRNMVMNKV